ncbi:alkyl sulfatase dimerization domain-containing protein [Natronorubrum sp. FCH18a]|uniref:alkyl sulfatase dimerization domain-containing protein n=1 Tax=Natronorubrum sp. FCH18a TaxID=3447018 RepID=UPI003F5143FB
MKDEAKKSHEMLGWSNDPVEVTDGTYFMSNISNVIAFETNDGLVLIDSGMSSGSRFNPAPDMASTLREFTDKPVHTAIYTHGHIDHIHGLKHFLKEDQSQPRVIAHENILDRFKRYERTVGLKEACSARQIGGTNEVTEEVFDEQTSYRTPDIPPDTLHEEGISIGVGEATFQIYHARGETNEHSWVYCPEREVICSSDLIINQAPNAGNPQKVQRYPKEWAMALKEMAAKDPRHLCPGHGSVFVDSPNEIQNVLLETAKYLDSIVEQTIDLLNDGAPPHVDIVQQVEPPETDAPWLEEKYDEAEFIVRNVIRMYSGWWSGRPSELKPSARDELATEITSLAGGPVEVAERALSLLDNEEFRLATHLVDYALEAAPENDRVQSAAITIYEARADFEDSLMATNLFLSAADYAADGRAFH